MMKRLLLLFALAMCVAYGALAQDIRLVEGRKHIAHTVQAGQTLYAVGRHYAVPVDAIVRANPAAAQGLSIGQTLLIPVDAQVKKELKTAPALAGGELAHTVAKKETLFGIARKYGVGEADLLARNPAARGGLQIGMVLFIPVAKVTEASGQTAPASDDKSTQHLVMPGETLFALGQRYGVKPEAIMAANGGLPEGLKAGTYLRIPAKVVEPEPVAEPVPVRSATGGTARVALLLPFNMTKNDSALSRASAGGKTMYPATDAAVQFYAGALIALDSLAGQGLRADLSVFEVDDAPGMWSAVQSEPGLQDAQLSIGPFYRAATEQFAQRLAGTHFVCPAPLSNKVLLGHPNVSKVQSGRPDQLQQIARYVAARHAEDNIILCSPDNPADKEIRGQVQRTLDEALASQPGRLRDSVLVVHGTKNVLADVIAKLNPGQQNVVVAASEDIEFVSGLVRTLAGLVKEKRIVLIGLNAWMGMETLEAQHLEALKTCVPVSTWIDHDDPAVQRFIREYRERWSNEPQEWAFLGFDVTYFYVTALHRFGPSFPDHFAEVDTRPLHLTFRLRKTGQESGWRNETGTILRYEEAGLRKAQ